MKFFSIRELILFLSFVPLFSSFSTLAGDRYVPPASDGERKKTAAQGTRSCAVAQGELMLEGASPLTVSERDFSLSFYYEPPSSQASEVMLISLVDLTLPAPLFFQEKALSGSGSFQVKVSAPLIPGRRYRLVAGLPCEGRRNGLKYLHVMIDYIPSTP